MALLPFSQCPAEHRSQLLAGTGTQRQGHVVSSEFRLNIWFPPSSSRRAEPMEHLHMWGGCSPNSTKPPRVSQPPLPRTEHPALYAWPMICILVPRCVTIFGDIDNLLVPSLTSNPGHSVSVIWLLLYLPVSQSLCHQQTLLQMI